MKYSVRSRRDILRAGLALGMAGSSNAAIKPSHPAAACIFLNLTGGPSQLDTWDMKPDAPSDIRGPFKPIKTNVSGIEISENFPRMARHADKYAIIRSVHRTGSPMHEAGHRVMQLDRLPKPDPGLFRCAPDARYGLNPFGQSCLRARHMIEAGVPFVAVDMFETVFERITWDIHGWKPFSPIGCYRDHVGPMFDMAFSSLIDDLHQRGLLATTMVVATGEFGRTPRINPAGGRDHWTQCWSMLMAGGPIQGGQVVGASDAIGAEPKDRPVTTGEIAATVYHGLGLPLESGADPIHELFT